MKWSIDMAKRKVETFKDSINIEVCLNPVRIQVENIENDELLMKRIQEKVLEEISQNFPKFKCSKINIDSLTMETVRVGMVVEEVNNPLRKGIVTAINNKTINVTLKGKKDMQGPPQVYRKSNASFEEAGSFYNELNVGDMPIDFYTEGEAGYLYYNNDIIPVVIGKSKGENYKLFPINGDGLYFYALNKRQMSIYFKGKKVG